ncbi:MAG: chlorohydrolase, partial [Thermoproteus sp.]
YVLHGVDLDVIEDGVVEIDDEGRVVGIGRYTGQLSLNLGHVVLMPQLVNAHVHPLDVAIADREDYYIDDLVGWPYGVKYVSLRGLVARGRHLRLLEAVARRIRKYGVGCVVAFAEYAARDVEKAFRKFNIDPLVFQEAHGDLPEHPYVQVASPLDHSPEYLRRLRSRAKLVATHVSETEDCHEEGDVELALKVLEADVLVHLVYATPEEIAEMPEGKTVVINPRANAYFVGRLPDVPALLRLKPLLGTDNVFMNEPDVWAEMKFLHAYAKTRGWPLDERTILQMAATWPWEKLRCGAPLEVGASVKAVAVALPYPTHNVYKFLVKRAGGQDVLAFMEGDRVVFQHEV